MYIPYARQIVLDDPCKTPRTIFTVNFSFRVVVIFDTHTAYWLLESICEIFQDLVMATCTVLALYTLYVEAFRKYMRNFSKTWLWLRVQYYLHCS